MSSYLVNRVTIVLERRYTMQRIQHVCKRSRGNLLVLTRAFSVNNEIYITFLLNSQAQGVSGRNEQSTLTPWSGCLSPVLVIRHDK